MARLVDHVEYKDGGLYWTTKQSGRRVGGRVGGVDSYHGYRRFKFQGKTYKEHRVIFYLFNGYWPKMIDHIDRNPLNNYVENLRDCTPRENNLNKKSVNVYRHGKGWRIIIDGTYHGIFRCFGEATRLAAEIRRECYAEEASAPTGK